MLRLSVLAILLLSCGSSPGGDRAFVFEGGTRVVVQSSGQIILERDGRDLVAIPPEHGPTIRTYTETFRGDLGIYEFRRRDVTEVELTATSSPSVGESNQVIIDYEGQGGSLRGTLAIERETDERTRFRFTLLAGEANSIAIPFRCDDEGSFHGFGEQYNGTDQRGEEFDLFVSEQGIGRDGSVRPLTGDEHTTYFPMPYWLDARGHGVLFETDYRVLADVCANDPGVAWIEVSSDDPVEWVVFHGPTPLDVVRQVGDHLGRPGPLPDWAFGLWIGSQGGQEAVLAEAAALEAANIPVAAFWVQDWTGVRMNIGGGFGVQYRWAVDPEHYPDLAGLIADLRGRGYRFLAYANPFIDPNLPDHFPAMDERGLLVQSPEGGSYRFTAPNIESAHPDLTNPETREFVKDALKAMVNDYGIDGWMHDFAEWNPLDGVHSDGSDPLAYHNRFPVEWQRMAREALDEVRPDGDYAFIVRSGWTGSQAVSQIHWVGDQEADWETTDGIPTVVPALLNLGLAGQYNVTHDVAGFSGGPSTKELFMRWTELGAFTPIFRTHEGNNRDDNWSWEKDAETTEHFARFARVHDALAPLFRRLADEAQEDSAPIVRHLMLQYPADRETWSISDEYLIGNELLVAPITEEGSTSREVYLPEGTWFHVWTGESFSGGQRISIDAPIGSPPVFSRGEDRTDLRAIE
ncbi:MAG: TIM-barrel domain-containing protein [Myxococcota bacterium]